MKQPHTIEIVIETNGQITSEVRGVAGADCSTLTKWLDKLGVVEVDEKTPEFYKQAKQTVQVGKS